MQSSRRLRTRPAVEDHPINVRGRESEVAALNVALSAVRTHLRSERGGLCVDRPLLSATLDDPSWSVSDGRTNGSRRPLAAGHGLGKRTFAVFPERAFAIFPAKSRDRSEAGIRNQRRVSSKLCNLGQPARGAAQRRSARCSILRPCARRPDWRAGRLPDALKKGLGTRLAR